MFPSPMFLAKAGTRNDYVAFKDLYPSPFIYIYSTHTQLWGPTSFYSSEVPLFQLVKSHCTQAICVFSCPYTQ